MKQKKKFSLFFLSDISFFFLSKQDFEIIVIDDASPDGTLEVAKESLIRRKRKKKEKRQTQ